MKISTGERTLVRKNTERIGRWIFDLDGKLRLATRTADNGEQEMLRVDPDGFKRSTHAASSRRAARCVSTRTASASTWRRIKATMWI